MFEELNTTPRLLIQQDLCPVQGDRFQPTGFADIGPAVYQRHDGTRMLLVESAQSVANRMELTCVDGIALRPELDGLPYVKARLTGQTETETSSLVEAHRINSPFIISDDGFQKRFVERAKYAKGKPLDWKAIASAVFAFDPNSLIHGVFMANLEDGRVRLPRALTGFIEAVNVYEAVSGGVKNNPLDPTGKIRAANYDKDVYSNVPYARTEYTAESITAYFNLDIALLRGYGLSEAAFELLVALSLLKIRRFLNEGLRLRTACDLSPHGDILVSPANFRMPSVEDLLAHVQKKIQECKAANLLEGVTEITTKVVLKAASA